jgi:hypothetical protein
MYHLTKIILVLGALGILTGCGGGGYSNRVVLELPADAAPADPSDEYLVRDIQKFLASSGAPAHSIYSFRRYDLNDDGLRDALVILQNPYGYWCGLYGCSMLVMQAEEDSFKLVNAVQPVREPLYVSEGKTNGWKDLIIHVSGRWSETKDVALQFDGSAYPANPSDLPAYLMLASNATPLFLE